MNSHHKEKTMSDLHWGPSLSEVSHSQYLLIQGNRAFGIVRTCLNCQYDCHFNVKGPGHQQLWSEYYDFIGIWRLMQVPITYAWAVYVQRPGTLKHFINTCGTRSTAESADPASNLRNMKSLPKRNYQYCHYLPITRTSFAMPNAVSVAVSNTSHVYKQLSTRHHIPVNCQI